MCTKNHNIWCTVPEIQSQIDKIFLSLWAILHPFTTPTPTSLMILKIKILHYMTIIWCMVPEIWRYGVQWTEFFVILDPFLPFYPLTTWKIQILKIWKKHLEQLSFYMCNTNDNHMIYGSWDMEHDGQNLLSFWTIFCTFTPLTTRKIKILKKWKKHLEILSLYTSVP